MKRFRDDMAPLSVEHVTKIADRLGIEITTDRSVKAKKVVDAIADACNAFAPGFVVASDNEAITGTSADSVNKKQKKK
jgi:hypothetical protein